MSTVVAELGVYGRVAVEATGQETRVTRSITLPPDFPSSSFLAAHSSLGGASGAAQAVLHPATVDALGPRLVAATAVVASSSSHDLLFPPSCPAQEEKVWGFLIGCTEYLAHLHAHGLHHAGVAREACLARADGAVVLLGPALHVTEVAQVPAHRRSPECFTAAAAARRACDDGLDMWGLGCVCYWLLTGREPFAAASDDPDEAERAVVEDEPRPLPPSVTPELRFLVAKLLEKDPRRRPDAAAVLAYSAVRVRVERERLRRREEAIDAAIREAQDAVRAEYEDKMLHLLDTIAELEAQLAQRRVVLQVEAATQSHDDEAAASDLAMTLELSNERERQLDQWERSLMEREATIANSTLCASCSTTNDTTITHRNPVASAPSTGAAESHRALSVSLAGGHHLDDADATLEISGRVTARSGVPSPPKLRRVPWVSPANNSNNESAIPLPDEPSMIIEPASVVKASQAHHQSSATVRPPISPPRKRSVPGLNLGGLTTLGRQAGGGAGGANSSASELAHLCLAAVSSRSADALIDGQVVFGWRRRDGHGDQNVPPAPIPFAHPQSLTVTPVWDNRAKKVLSEPSSELLVTFVPNQGMLRLPAVKNLRVRHRFDSSFAKLVVPRPVTVKAHDGSLLCFFVVRSTRPLSDAIAEVVIEFDNLNPVDAVAILAGPFDLVLARLCDDCAVPDQALVQAETTTASKRASPAKPTASGGGSSISTPSPSTSPLPSARPHTAPHHHQATAITTSPTPRALHFPRTQPVVKPVAKSQSAASQPGAAPAGASSSSRRGSRDSISSSVSSSSSSLLGSQRGSFVNSEEDDDVDMSAADMLRMLRQQKRATASLASTASFC
jgi:hypothetical protein